MRSHKEEIGTNPNIIACPPGSPEGGRFTSGEAGLVAENPTANKPGEAGNGGPPEIPNVAPATEELRNVFVKLAARWLARALAGGAAGPAGEFVVALEAAAETALWLHDKYPYIKAYLDAPKSLDELQSSIGKPEKGYEVHHFVEQSAAESDGHSREDIDGPDNLVRIPTLKHWEITGWYMTPNPLFDGLSPREYLRGKSWDERRKVGLGALKRFKVLTP